MWKNTTLSAKDYMLEAFVYTFDYPRPLPLKGAEPWATSYKLPDDAVIPCRPKPDYINIVVVGGQTDAFFQVGNLSYRKGASNDEWA